MGKTTSKSQGKPSRGRERGGDAQRGPSLEVNRTRAVTAFAEHARGQTWSRALFLALLEELWVTDEFDALLGAPERIPPRRYAEAIAVAIALRHSWRRDDFETLAALIKSTSACLPGRVPCPDCAGRRPPRPAR